MTAVLEAPSRPALPAPADVLDVLAEVDASPVPRQGVTAVEEKWTLSRRLAVRAIRYAVTAMPDDPTAIRWAELIRIGETRINGVPSSPDPFDAADDTDRQVDAYYARIGER